MQFEPTHIYRVKAVAEALDVSVATIYRAIESGELEAFKIGSARGRGAIRVFGGSVTAYLAACGISPATAVEGARGEGR